MKTQPVPAVKAADISRIVRRDFHDSQFDTVMSIIGEYGVEKWHGGSDRVKAAVLKLADGRLHALREAMEAAKRDFRDVIVAAEYPEYGRRTGSPVRKLEGAEWDQVINRDWDQYEAWLEKP